MNNFSIADLKTPDYRLLVDGDDLSAIVSNRLISITITDSRGLESDNLQIELQDSEDDLALPPLTAKISVALGWKNQQLTDKGIFTVSEIDYSGPPNKLILTAYSADLRATNKHGITAAKSRSFHNTTLGEIVNQLANEHSLTSNISEGLSGIRVNHLDQTGESDISLLSRLGDKYNAVVSVKHGRLLFLSFGKGVSISGKALPATKIRIEECSNFNYRRQSRDAYTGVIVYWNNLKGGKRQKITLGTSEQAKELKQTFASEDEALQAARSELERLQRATESLNLTLINGRAEIEAEAPLVLEGFKPEIQKIKWAIASVVHSLGDHGYTTQISAEPMIKISH